MTKHTMIAFCPFGLQPDALEVKITYTFSPGRPAVMYLRNGDPGYPADPAEVEFEAAELLMQDIGPSMQNMLNEWAVEYLASDAGYQAACENISADAEDARDYYTEAKDARLERKP